MSQEILDSPNELKVRALRLNLMTLAFTKGMIFWYAIEKIFYAQNDISLSRIVLLGVVAQGSKVIFELPTSVVADRWSRRNLLILANLSMITSNLVLGLGSTFDVFVIGILFWSLYDALSSGVYEAFTYDGLASNGLKQTFKKTYGRMEGLENLVLAIVGLIAGLISSWAGFRGTFFITIVPMLASTFVLLRMPEPKIRRTLDDDVTWLRHIHGAFSLMRQPDLRWPMLLIISLIGLQCVWYEYYQLVGIDLKMSTILFGIMFSVILLGMALSLEIARHLPSSRLVISAAWSLLVLTHVIGLRARDTWLTILNLVGLYMAIRIMQFYLEVYIQNHVESSRRATILSLATTIAYGWFFVLIGVFTLVLNRYGVRWAFTVAASPMLGLALVDMARAVPWAENKLVSEEMAYDKHD